MTLTELKDNVGKYMVYYAGLSADPTAILFVPKKGPSDLNLTLSDDWRQMRLYSDLRGLIGNLEYNEPAFTVKLRAVVPPKESPGPDDLLAYIYSKHRASLRQIEPGAYRLGDVIGASGGPGSGAIIPGRDRD